MQRYDKMNKPHHWYHLPKLYSNKWKSQARPHKSRSATSDFIDKMNLLNQKNKDKMNLEIYLYIFFYQPIDIFICVHDGHILFCKNNNVWTESKGLDGKTTSSEKCHGDNKTNPSWLTHMNVILYLHNLIVKFNFIYDFVISF